MALCMMYVFERCVILLSFHLCMKALPKDLKILSFGKKNIIFSEVEQMMGEKK